MTKKKHPKESQPKERKAQAVVCQNRRAKFDYHLEERFEAGLALTGSEVKSLRKGKANLSDAYAEIRGNEAFLIQANIEPYDKGGYANHEPKRKRKLLLHKKEIQKLIGKTQIKGKTLVPTKIYFKNGYAKVEIALGSGKQTIDKRQTIKDREIGRDMQRAMRRKR